MVLSISTISYAHVHVARFFSYKTLRTFHFNRIIRSLHEFLFAHLPLSSSSFHLNSFYFLHAPPSLHSLLLEGTSLLFFATANGDEKVMKSTGSIFFVYMLGVDGVARHSTSNKNFHLLFLMLSQI